jgi:molecular chaperone DnaJ
MSIKGNSTEICRMPLKDYYQILELGPEASETDIRRSYRRLAMLHHPDKNPDDRVAEAIFREVQEAYDTLTDPWKKDAYLQLRWYEQSQGRRMSGLKALTSVNILKDLLQLDRYISVQNPYHIDRKGLSAYLLQTVSPEAIVHLNTEKDRSIVQEIIATALRPAKHLRPEDAAPVIERLQALAAQDPELAGQIDHFNKTMNDRQWWEKWKFLILVAVTAIICLVIARWG